MNTFDEKVRSMTAAEIIMAMVEGLRNPVTKVNMDTFGSVIDGVCFGCAATNAICKIGGVSIADFFVGTRLGRAERVEASIHLISAFEAAIESLRMGRIADYNHFATEGRFAQIRSHLPRRLPKLRNGYAPEQLNVYEQLAKAQ